jgi:hypothetical protein
MNNPIQLRRTDRGWQIVLTDFSSAPEKMPGQIALTRELAGAFSQLADEVAAGKHATVQDAEMAVQQRINEVMMEAARHLSPATAPSTQPRNDE